jgi:hypothetical protein
MQGADAENRTNIITSAQRWLVQALRSALFLRPDTGGLRASPLGLLVLMAVLLAGSLLLQRAYIPGPALFYWQALGSGWGVSLLVLWACWMAVRSGESDVAVPTLFALLLLQQALIAWPLWGAHLAMQRLALGPAGVVAAMADSYLPWVVSGWMALAGAVLLLRHASHGLVRLGVALAFAATVLSDIYLPPAHFWYPDLTAAKEDELEDRRLRLTQELLEQQSAVVVSTLNGLQPQRPGVIDVYALTFAPFAGEEVFRRESRLVSDLMRSRFDAEGRTLSLINHADTAAELPWATGLNLRRAIARAASVMDRDEDLLFIHLTSHGARNGRLAADFAPLSVDDVRPEQLRAWLDEAGVRFRVISVSACYSGSWLPALADPGTLTMTAADATHTSYGCGRGSELTYFGRAMYAEQLRSTRSFEAAHAAAREVIKKREQDAGKKDGYSNPQIQVGEAIRPRLAELAARLDAAVQ